MSDAEKPELAYRRGVQQALNFAYFLIDGCKTTEEAQNRIRKAERLAREIRSDMGRKYIGLIHQMDHKLKTGQFL